MPAPVPPRDVPAYLPVIAWPLLAWCRAHVARVARRYHVGTADLWDETITALLRAALYFIPERPADYVGPYPTALAPDKSFRHYAKIAVHRACWRYVARRAEKLPHFVRIAEPPRGEYSDEAPHFTRGRSIRDQIPADECALDLELAWHSAEDEVMAREAVYLKALNSALHPLTDAVILVHSQERPEHEQDAGQKKLRPRTRAAR